jgi:uncharacterized protein (TIGR03083 family)
MDHAGFCNLLEVEANRFAEVVKPADPAAPVPTCPDWTVADLISHLGGVHRWAAHHVATLAPRRVSSADLDLRQPEDPSALAEWLAAGIGPMVATFRSADPDAKVWGWGADRHARFWPRRMVHETAVHRADATFAVGAEPEIDDVVAVDGIDELLANLPHAAYFAPGVGELRGDGESIGLKAGDCEASWRIRLLPAGFAWDWSAEPSEVDVHAVAADLLLLVYGRRRLDDAGRFEIRGDRALLERFVSHAAL